MFADVNGDGRVDLVVQALEFFDADDRWDHAGVAWLEQPLNVEEPWRLHRVGTILPDWSIGIGVADIDGDGWLDVITGGYSGLNVLKGGYSGASRDVDDPSVTHASSVARIAWFRNPGKTADAWQRHDISRRVRGMYDMFVARDMDADGDIDFVATRGNSGRFDGVFWLEQRRSMEPVVVFTGAHADDSRSLPLPPPDWRAHYDTTVRYVAPNKAAQTEALRRE